MKKRLCGDAIGCQFLLWSVISVSALQNCVRERARNREHVGIRYSGECLITKSLSLVKQSEILLYFTLVKFEVINNNNNSESYSENLTWSTFR